MHSKLHSCLHDLGQHFFVHPVLSRGGIIAAVHDVSKHALAFVIFALKKSTLVPILLHSRKARRQEGQGESGMLGQQQRGSRLRNLQAGACSSRTCRNFHFFLGCTGGGGSEGTAAAAASTFVPACRSCLQEIRSKTESASSYTTVVAFQVEVRARGKAGKQQSLARRQVPVTCYASQLALAPGLVLRHLIVLIICTKVCLINRACRLHRVHRPTQCKIVVYSNICALRN